MGCLWSREREGRDHCTQRNRTAVNNLVIVDRSGRSASRAYIVSESSTFSRARSTNYYSPPEPKFGEYRCSACGRYWNSRRCWPNKYQMCQTCKKPTLPFKCRDLKPTDLTSSVDNRQEHVRELCQMCQQLGYSCKDYDKKYKSSAPTMSRTTKMTTRTYQKEKL